jgi:thioredoxin 1
LIDEGQVKEDHERSGLHGHGRRLPEVHDEALSTEMPNVHFGKLNTDENQMTAVKNGVMSIPTLMIYKDGKKVDQVVGAVPKEMLVSSLKKHL